MDGGQGNGCPNVALRGRNLPLAGPASGHHLPVVPWFETHNILTHSIYLFIFFVFCGGNNGQELSAMVTGLGF